MCKWTRPRTHPLRFGQYFIRTRNMKRNKKPELTPVVSAASSVDLAADHRVHLSSPTACVVSRRISANMIFNDSHSTISIQLCPRFPSVPFGFHVQVCANHSAYVIHRLTLCYDTCQHVDMSLISHTHSSWVQNCYDLCVCTPRSPRWSDCACPPVFIYNL